ncbi:MAG: serine hydrolase [Clostridium sp.]|uniref:serine hydrolase domain-containing protein n=1 Tax=Clostridium sp. TaxID=1506 RepID=UPI00290D9686|nr:serine hydrolase [Clostridium sp.]MDU5740809.1 serine hydrolase [Clostridium sp.]MDU5785277.1 serine hydrolase [Clostridium sp.]
MRKDQKREIKLIIEECCSRGVFPGANVAILLEDEEYLFSVGKKSILPKEELNSIDTIYDIASLTKVLVTTTLIMKLIDMGKLKLDTLVKDIIPEFRNNNNINIFDLLTHTSGLPADIKLDLSVDKETIRKKIHCCDSVYEKNTKVLYSDIGFILLGFIIEEIVRKPLDIIAKEFIFTPLNMNDTSYLPDSKLFNRCAPTENSPHFHKILRGEVHDRKAYLMGGVSGHAGVFSDIDDMSKFARMILNRGEYNKKRILSEKSVESLFKTQTPIGEINRGLGYLTFDIRSPFSTMNSGESIFHTGFTGTSLLIDKGNKISIIVLSNRVHPTRENIKIIEERKKIHEKIMRILLS